MKQLAFLSLLTLVCRKNCLKILDIYWYEALKWRNPKISVINFRDYFWFFHQYELKYEFLVESPQNHKNAQRYCVCQSSPKTYDFKHFFSYRNENYR